MLGVDGGGWHYSGTRKVVWRGEDVGIHAFRDLSVYAHVICYPLASSSFCWVLTTELAYLAPQQL